MKVKQGFRKRFHRSLTSSAGASYPAVAGLLAIFIGLLMTPILPPVGAVIMTFAVGLMGVGIIFTPVGLIGGALT